jgi:hypothetical protein
MRELGDGRPQVELAGDQPVHCTAADRQRAGCQENAYFALIGVPLHRTSTFFAQ